MVVRNQMLRISGGVMLLVVVTGVIVASAWVYRITQFDPAMIDHREEGRVDAKCDLKQGRLTVKLTGMGFQAEDPYREILRKDYGIELERVASCLVNAELVDYVEGYNAVMVEAVEERFGAEALEKSLAQAEGQMKDQINSPILPR